MVPRTFEFALALEPYAYDPAKARQLLAQAGYPNGFDGGDFYPYPPYFSPGEAIVANFGAVGIRMKVRTMERAAFQTAWFSKKLHGVCLCTVASYGNAATRLAEQVQANGAYARGVDPDVEALYTQQARERDPKKREAALHQIQRLLYERVRFGPLWEFIWVSAVGPRVAEPALMLIDPYPWSAPLEEVRLKTR
jgi:peptide/nickel transport system substrate-binding protein